MSRKFHSSAAARLKQDYLRIIRDPVPYITAAPLHSNILEWHYVVTGPEKTPYEGGFYHGKLVFPRDFPFKPPKIFMITPNGRFKTNTRLCLSISDFHPDTWNPAWSVSTILTGLLSFMVETAPTLGSIETTDYQKRQLAGKSGPFNIKDPTFCELFPEITEEIQTKLRLQEEAVGQQSETLASTSTSTSHNNEGEMLNGAMGSTFANICVIIGFAAFAFAVKCVIKAVSEG